jgi:hypothetical protein
MIIPPLWHSPAGKRKPASAVFGSAQALFAKAFLKPTAKWAAHELILTINEKASH